MDDSNRVEAKQSEAPDPAVQVGVTFLRALFAEEDTVLFRPIETWVEQDRKRSRVDYRNTCYRRAVPALLQLVVAQLLKLAEKDPVNLFFGVCPRFGNKGRFDLAWQIRTVRVLWTDIDHVTVDEARERVTKAGLPAPSMIVNSGNGVHLYWLLDQPYVIDDVGEPPPVETEWTQGANGRKKPRKYIVENDDRVYLDQRRHVSRLSAKAEHLQDVLAGIANAVGGDHTTDLSRLLRLPGTFNRKDQRNGADPVPTALVECDPSRKYSLVAFEPLKATSPETERAKQIAAMPLPTPRKPSLSKSDKLAELVAASVHLVSTDPPYNVRVEPRSNNAIAAGLSSFSNDAAAKKLKAGQGNAAFDVARGKTKVGNEHHQKFDLARHPEKAKPTQKKMRAKDRPLANDFVSDEEFDEMLHAWFGNIARVLLPGHGFYVWGGYANVANYPPVFKACGMYFSQAVIWHKMHPVLTRKDFMGDHEWCFYGWREGAAHRWFGPNNVPDVWSVKKVNPQSMIHLTEKPVELTVRAIQYSSLAGENVLDLFGGSGSTLIGCEQTGRKAFLMELDPPYCDVIVERWEKFTGKKAERVEAVAQEAGS